jgi:CheY-like chemotaxis protein
MALVLIVEDSDAVTPLEIALASIAGMRTLVVPNGREALRLLRTNPADLAAVVTDLNLPYVDGFELIAAIRSDARYCRLPIVVISGDHHPESSTKARALGANVFFPKPYSPHAIKQTLEGLLYAP